jgi:DNA-binding transcriptional MerR regulator
LSHEIAWRLGVDVKEVRHALKREQAPPNRASPACGQRLDAHRERIVELLQMEPRINARRVGRLIGADAIPIGERAIREHVSRLRAQRQPKRPANADEDRRASLTT